MSLTQITTGGVDENINIDSNTLKVDGTNNRVGVGTAAPGKLLSLQDSTTPSLALYTGSTIRAELKGTSALTSLLSYSNSPITFKIGGSAETEALRIDGSGRVGIGESSPAANLEITPGTGAGTLLLNHASGSTTDGALNIEVNSSGAFYETRKTGGLPHVWYAAGVERMRIDSSGRLGIGTSSPANKLHVSDTSGSAQIRITGSSGSSNIYADSNIYFQPNGSTAVTFASSGKVGIGRTSASSMLDIQAASGRTQITLRNVGNTADASTFVAAEELTSNNADLILAARHSVRFFSNLNEKMRIDSSGNVGVGVTSVSSSRRVEIKQPSSYSAAVRILADGNGNDGDIEWFSGLSQYGLGVTQGTDAIRFRRDDAELMRIDSSGRLLVGTSTNLSSAGGVQIYNSSPYLIGCKADNNPAQGAVLMGMAGFSQSGTSFENAAFVRCEAGGSTSSGNHPGQIVFGTIATGTSSAERMRIKNDGTVLVGQTTDSFGNKGHILNADGRAFHTVEGNTPLWINRLSNDGNLIAFYQNSTQEGSVEVNGTTVSYNGAHLSRWSQLAGGVARTEILRGSVLSNLDEMCEWGEEDNEQLNRMKVSDVEGDKNVSGVFQAWDDDDDTYVNDFYCAMTGDFVIRIAQGTTVARGDLLMSAGDGTAKPQDDDIVRSQTIAKVTSTTVSTTYSDNSYCVPCVLMAC